MEQTLDAKTQVLVALGAAVAAKCQDCFVKLYRAAPDAGVTDREVRAVTAIAAKVAEKSAGFMARFVEETTHGPVAVTEKTAPATKGCCG